VWTGAAVTAVGFTIGKTLIGLYLGRSTVASVYGAAGSLIVILLWVYYSAQIVFFGAEFTKVYARRFGTTAMTRSDDVSAGPAGGSLNGVRRLSSGSLRAAFREGRRRRR